MLGKLRNRILLLNVIITSLVMLIAFAAIYATTQSSLQLEERNKLDSLVGVDSELLLENWQASNLSIAFVAMVDDEGDLLEVYTTASTLPRSFYAEAALAARWGGAVGEYSSFNDTWRYQVQGSGSYSEYTQSGRAVLDAPSAVFTISFLDVTGNRATLQDLLFNLILVGVVMLAAIFVVSRYVAGRAIKPVAEAWEQQRRFVADASHELKTPLMTIMSNCDVLEANEDESIKSQREWLDSIKLGADRMGRLISSLLALARTENAALPQQKQHFSLESLTNELVLSLDGLARAKGLQVELVALPPSPEVLGYEDLVRQVLTILYENALKYANEGGTVELAAQIVGKQVVYSVRNTGQGIAAEDLPHIFDRFYRADAARSAEDNSYGLGLSIARSVAEGLGGQLTAQSTPGGWTEFSFRFNA